MPVLLIVIAIIALFIRLYKLSNIPPGVSWDEANNAYEGYLLLKTGKDEWGNWLPIYSKRFGDYSSQVYAYFAVPAIWLFGLNPFSSRLPSAIAGTISTIFLYILTKNFLQLTHFKKKAERIALITSALWAFNPWNIHFSRHALEANLALSLAVISLTFLFIFLKKEQYYNLFASITFAILSTYTYYNSRLVIPLLFIYLFLLERKKVIRQKKTFFIAVIFGLILLIPFFNSCREDNIFSRYKELSIFSDPYRKQEFSQLFIQGKQGLGKISPFFQTKFFFFTQEIFEQVKKQLSPRFLFLGGDSNYRYGVKIYGKFLLPSFIFLIMGLFYFLQKTDKWRFFVFYWIIVAILPTIFSNESPHPFRAYFLLPILLILISIGIYSTINNLFNYKKHFFISIVFFSYIVSFSLYFHYYLVHFPYQADYDWQAFYNPAINFLADKQEKYDKIIFTAHYHQPHIFLFFYQKIDPLRVQKAIAKEKPAFSSIAAIDRFENFRFRPINWQEDIKCDNCLIIDNKYHPEVSDELYLTDKKILIKRLKTIMLNNGQHAFSIFETRKIK